MASLGDDRVPSFVSSEKEAESPEAWMVTRLGERDLFVDAEGERGDTLARGEFGVLDKGAETRVERSIEALEARGVDGRFDPVSRR